MRKTDPSGLSKKIREEKPKRDENKEQQTEFEKDLI